MTIDPHLQASLETAAVAFVVGFGMNLLPTLQTGTPPTSWGAILTASAVAGIAYAKARWSTAPQDVPTMKAALAAKGPVAP